MCMFGLAALRPMCLVIHKVEYIMSNAISQVEWL